MLGNIAEIVIRWVRLKCIHTAFLYLVLIYSVDSEKNHLFRQITYLCVTFGAKEKEGSQCCDRPMSDRPHCACALRLLATRK